VTYVVQRGDTLGSIARRTDSTLEALIRANCLRNPRLIVAGETLFVPRTPDPRPTGEDLYQRCIEAGGDPERCRIFVLEEGELEDAIRERVDEAIDQACAEAGLPPEVCRAIIRSGAEEAIEAVCLAAGYDAARCAALADSIVNGEGTALERCLSAGFTEEECRDLLTPYDGEPPCEPGDGRCAEQVCEQNPLLCETVCEVAPEACDGEREERDGERLAEICEELGLETGACARLLALIESGINGRIGYERCIALGFSESTCTRIFGEFRRPGR
jgi:LysM repeat protein